MLLLTACKDSDIHTNILFSQQGAHIMRHLLHHVTQTEEASPAADTLGILVHQIAYQQGHLPDLLIGMAAEQTTRTSASSVSEDGGLTVSGHAVCVEQVIALQLLADELENTNDR